MRSLMRSEWFKLSKSFGFKILMFCNALSLFSTIVLLMVGTRGTGYEMFVLDLTYLLHHSIIGYLFAAIFFCNEFSNRTFGMSLLCGHSRKKVFLSKVLMFYLGLIILFLIYIGVTTIVMSIGNGFGLVFDFETCKNVLLLLLSGMLGCIAMGSIIILVATIVKRTIVTIGIGIAITYALLWLETNFRDRPIFLLKYTYSYQIGQLQFWGEGFSFIQYLIVMIVTVIIAMGISITIFEKSELK